MKKYKNGKPFVLPVIGAICRTRRIFARLGLVVAVLGFGGIYKGAAWEGSVTATLLPAALQAAASSAAVRTTPQPLPHPLETDQYYKYCNRCHGSGKMMPYPENHSEYSEDGCLNCHRPGSALQTDDSDAANGEGAVAGIIPHAIEEPSYLECTMCHGSVKEAAFPEDHARHVMNSCTGCHKPGVVSKGEDIGGVKTEEGKPAPIPHSIEQFAPGDCVMCHGEEKMKPFPANHFNYAKDGCAECHRPSR